MPEAETDRAFPTTNWSLLFRARSNRSLDGNACLGQLVERYAPALRRFLRRVRGVDADKADEIVQGFIADKLVTRRLLEKVDQNRGRFRTLLLHALNNYVTDLHRRASVRGGTVGTGAAALADLDERFANGRDDPSAAFDLEWARSVLTDAVLRMREYCEKRDRSDLWVAFEARILRPTADGVLPVSYKQLAARLGLRSSTEASGLLYTAKRIFDRKLSEVLLDSALPGADPKTELMELRKIFARCVKSPPYSA